MRYRTKTVVVLETIAAFLVFLQIQRPQRTANQEKLFEELAKFREDGKTIEIALIKNKISDELKISAANFGNFG